MVYILGGNTKSQKVCILNFPPFALQNRKYFHVVNMSGNAFRFVDCGEQFAREMRMQTVNLWGDLDTVWGHGPHVLSSGQYGKTCGFNACWYARSLKQNPTSLTAAPALTAAQLKAWWDTEEREKWGMSERRFTTVRQGLDTGDVPLLSTEVASWCREHGLQYHEVKEGGRSTLREFPQKGAGVVIFQPKDKNTMAHLVCVQFATASLLGSTRAIKKNEMVARAKNKDAPTCPLFMRPDKRRKVGQAEKPLTQTNHGKLETPLGNGMVSLRNGSYACVYCRDAMSWLVSSSAAEEDDATTATPRGRS